MDTTTAAAAEDVTANHMRLDTATTDAAQVSAWMILRIRDGFLKLCCSQDNKVASNKYM